MNASFSHTWTHQFGNLYFNNRFGTQVSNFSLFGSYPSNPNEKTQNEYTDWNAKITSTIDAGWGLRVTPVVKLQSGAPYGRLINANLNYGAQRVLVEPLGARRQETVAVVDFRAEKQITLDRARFGLFVDVFNLPSGVTAGHIHVGAPGTPGPTVVNFVVPTSASNDFRIQGSMKDTEFTLRPDQGIRSADDMFQAILGGNSYVNVHTQVNGGGEIRGQLALKP